MLVKRSLALDLSVASFDNELTLGHLGTHNSVGDSFHLGSVVTDGPTEEDEGPVPFPSLDRISAARWHLLNVSTSLPRS
jgi:hypothetical protein